MIMITCVCHYAVKHIILAVIIYLCIFKECRATILISFINRYIPSGIEREPIRSATKLRYEMPIIYLLLLIRCQFIHPSLMEFSALIFYKSCDGLFIEYYPIIGTGRLCRSGYATYPLAALYLPFDK